MALAVPTLAFIIGAPIESVSASVVSSEANLTDEQFFANAYKGLTPSEVKTYVGYLDEKDKVNAWIVLEKERINGFTDIDEYVRQGLTDKLTANLELKTKAVKSGLTSTDQTKLDHESFSN